LDKSELPIIYGWPRKIAVLSKLRDRAQHGVYPFAHFFNGALLSLAAVRQVGNVNQEFFIYGEEVDYFFRLRAHGPIISVLDALHFHPDVSQRPYNPLKVYYYIKNSLILNRLHYDYVALRNVFMVGLIFYRLLKRNGFLFALSLAIGRNAPILYRSISQGLAGRLGRDFRG
jgi:GT2 family glycosyltransferase